jgi:hypothetical protein
MSIRTRLKGWFAAGCAGLALCPLVTLADDISRGVPLAGLTSVPATSLRATDVQLQLDDDAVLLHMALLPTTSGAALTLSGPRFAWMGEAEPYPDRQFPELHATLDGKVLASQSPDFVAFAGGREITSDLLELGIDPFVIATTPPFVYSPQDTAGRAKFQRLQSLGAVLTEDGQYLARWQAQRLLRWQIGAAQAVFTLAYKARPAFALQDLQREPALQQLKAYCATPALLRQRLAQAGQSSAFVFVKQYAIAVGIDGHAPKSLSVLISEPNAVFCAADGKAAFGGGKPVAARGVGGIFYLLKLEQPS